MSLSVTEHRTLEGLRNLGREWNALLAECAAPNVFLTFEWVATWWNWFGKDGTPLVFEVRDGAALIAVAPFYLGQLRIAPGLRRTSVRFIGDGALVYPDYLGALLRDRDRERASAAIAGALLARQSEWRWISLAGFSDGAQSANSLVAVLRQSLRGVTLAGDRCPYIILPRRYEEFLAGLAPRRRESIRRYDRKARKDHHAELRSYHDAGGWLEGFALVAEVYRRSLRGGIPDRCFAAPDYAGFHRDLGAAFAARGWLRLYVLFFDGVPVAYIYGYVFAGKFWYYQTAYDLSREKARPGAVLLQWVIAEAIGEGLAEFDFLRGDESYKYYFTGRERRLKTELFFKKRDVAYLGWRTWSAVRRRAGGVKRALHKTEGDRG